ncbi:cytochrome c biogenesis CcdA family protein [Pseudopelagicola sp. nBUS_19]|uniref:cytochrome c biogenesis CcdA family protein n=1 Tax=Pseudopelagicola sp. nBUS_19 TaxID=3395316 RepID=UPI003EBAEDBE
MFDVSLVGAFVAGLLSFVSPCILPIVPFYLSYLAGVSMTQISTTSLISPRVRWRAFVTSICFALGVIVVFIGLGATATLFGQVVREYFNVLRRVAASLIMVMGLHFLGIFKIGFLYRQFRMDLGKVDNVGLVGAFVIGLAFAFGWTPCVGPVLAAILFTAAGQETASHGVMLLFLYGLGMTAPFVFAAIFVAPFMRWMVRFRPYLGAIEKIMGCFLVLFSLLIETNTVNIIAQWMLNVVPWFNSVG